VELPGEQPQYSYGIIVNIELTPDQRKAPAEAGADATEKSRDTLNGE
jgi:hypothetical protein